MRLELVRSSFVRCAAVSETAAFAGAKAVPSSCDGDGHDFDDSEEVPAEFMPRSWAWSGTCRVLQRVKEPLPSGERPEGPSYT